MTPFRKALQRGAPPCERGSCPHLRYCSGHEVACTAFLRFVQVGRTQHWGGDTPKAANYAKAFPPDDDVWPVESRESQRINRKRTMALKQRRAA